MKLDANDQEEIFNNNREEILSAFRELNTTTTIIEWDKPSNVIASEIADQFFNVTSLFHADLRRMIIKAIDQDRERATRVINDRQ